MDHFESIAGSIHVLLTDLILPRMNVSDLSGKFLAKKPDIKVLYMTGYEAETHGLDALPGKADLLRKPFSLTQVISAVQATLDSQ